MWAKKGNEFINIIWVLFKKMDVAKFSMTICDAYILLPISVSVGTKLYEYMFYSEIEKLKKNILAHTEVGL